MAGDNISEEAAIAAAGFPGLKGMDLAKVVSTKKATSGAPVWELKTDSHATIEAPSCRTTWSPTTTASS
jgi:carbamoyl-phosphate synthase small subunit